jgi:hypothetical protein
MAKKITFIVKGCDAVGMMREICAAGLRANPRHQNLVDAHLSDSGSWAVHSANGV